MPLPGQAVPLIYRLGSLELGPTSTLSKSDWKSTKARGRDLAAAGSDYTAAADPEVALIMARDALEADLTLALREPKEPLILKDAGHAAAALAPLLPEGALLQENRTHQGPGLELAREAAPASGGLGRPVAVYRVGRALHVWHCSLTLKLKGGRELTAWADSTSKLGALREASFRLLALLFEGEERKAASWAYEATYSRLPRFNGPESQLQLLIGAGVAAAGLG